MLLLHILTIFILSLFICFYLKSNFNKIEFLFENIDENKRKVHTVRSFRAGGLSFISLLVLFLLIESYELINILIFSFIFLSIGLIGDIKWSNTSKIRFLLMIIITFLFIYQSDLIIEKFNFIYPSYSFPLLQQFFTISIIIPILFTSLCIILSVNGFNFIDGQHGLLLGYSIILLIMLLLHLPYEKNIYLIILSLIASSFVLFLFNFISGNFFAGDSGAYFLGFAISTLLIYCNNNFNLDSFLLACLIIYPITEVFVSFTRRQIIQKTNSFEPDNKHLHFLLFQILLSKKDIQNTFSNNTINRMCSAIILSFIIMFNLLLYYFGSPNNYKLFLLLFIFTYLFAYFRAYKLESLITK